jgi:hypothetical protein
VADGDKPRNGAAGRLGLRLYELRRAAGRGAGLRDGPLDDTARREWAGLVERARPATALVTLPGLEAFRYWASHVVRFSFVLSPLARG